MFRRRIAVIFRAFLRDRSGTMAVTVIFLLLGLVVAIGMAVDYAMAMRDRTTLQGAADAAALAAARAASDHLAANGWSTANAAAAAEKGKSVAEATFAANAAKGVFAGAPSIATTMSIPSVNDVTANVTVAGDAPTSLMSAIGISKIALSVDASAKATLPAQYYQFVFLVDVSGSMAVGGTPAAIAKLQGSGKYDKCAFACHNPDGYYFYYSNGMKVSKDYRELARKDDIKLKIDYVNSATQTFFTSLDSAITASGGNVLTTIATYGTNYSTLVANATTISAAASAAAAIDVEPIQPASANWGYSKTTAALTSLKNNLKNVGDGTSATSRKTFVVFVTDGLQTLPGTCTGYGRCTDISYGTACTAIKNTGATLISIEATYPVIPGDTQYDQLVAPYSTQFSSVLKSCSSGGQWYFSAADGPAIQAAMSTIVTQITKSLRLAK